MSWAAEIAAAKREAIAFCKMALAQLFVYTLSAKGSAIGDKDSIQSDDRGQQQLSVVRIQPFGFRSVQPKGIRGLTVRLGASNLFYIGIGPTTAYGPQNLNPGAAAVWSSGGASMIVDENGKVTITDKGGATAVMDGTGNVSVNPATAKALKLGDQATPVTGSVQLGPVGNLQVLVEGALDGMGMPVTQAPAAVLSIVKAG